MDFQNLTQKELKYLSNKLSTKMYDLEREIKKEEFNLKRIKTCPCQYDGVAEALNERISLWNNVKAKYENDPNKQSDGIRYQEKINFLKKLEHEESESFMVTECYQYLNKEIQLELKKTDLKLSKDHLEDVESILSTIKSE